MWLDKNLALENHTGSCLHYNIHIEISNGPLCSGLPKVEKSPSAEAESFGQKTSASAESFGRRQVTFEIKQN